MYQEVLRSIDGIGIFPAVSLVVFVVVFALVVIYAARIDGDGVRHMAALPLEDDSQRALADQEESR